jgi:catechol 2,3-dioxygenase-like lactoylglutathione lyase family enzyme
VRIRLDHVVIHVSDWERSNKGAKAPSPADAGSPDRDVLGAELIDRGDGGPSRHYRLGDQQLNVHGPGVDPHPVAARPVEPGNSDLCFAWEGPIEGAVAHLRQHDVKVEEGPVTRHGARGEGTSVYFRDPDGSLLELISHDR